MEIVSSAWVVLFAPLFAAFAILLIGQRWKKIASGLAITAAAIAMILSWGIFLAKPDGVSERIPWISMPGVLEIAIGLRLDGLSSLMLVLVTTVATIVFIYSIGYMEHEEGWWRYFAGLSLFLFSMLGIVLADNFVMMFIFWELVGVSSYILIGHYYWRNAAAEASKQAFLVNRVGDFGFMLGILLFWVATGSVFFDEVIPKAGEFARDQTLFTLACILVFCGAIGKSAQLPLHIWLPNSMEGPTPVSSLLHAATMVAAGVYLVARIYPIVAFSELALQTIAWVGGLTALLAALMATQQNDIKRILAYSTISQLGYMFMAIGTSGSEGPAMFHLFTHAFFKCLLFLCAGSVIIGMHHEQDIWKMGTLKNKMPITFLCSVAGALALAGCPLFSGYYSKDLIILWAFEKMPLLGLLSILTAGLTSFYIFRLVFVVFLGPPRSTEAKKVGESPMVILAPLAILSLFSFASGWPFVAEFFFGKIEHPEHYSHLIPWILKFVFIVGVALAYLLYRRAEKDPISIPLFARRFYIDDLYAQLVKILQDGTAHISAWFDRWVLDILVVQIPSKFTWACGFVLRFFQIGNLQAYGFLFGAGAIGLLYILFFK